MIIKVDSTPIDKWNNKTGFICKTVRSPGSFGPTDCGKFSVCFFDVDEQMRQADITGRELKFTGEFVTTGVVRGFLNMPIKYKEFENELKNTLHIIEKLN